MMLLALFCGGLSLLLIVFNVHPVWMQYVAFAGSLGLFLTLLLRGNKATSDKNTNSWLEKRGFIIVTFTLLAVLSFLARRYETVFDLSKYKNYSLRDQTIHWLTELTVPVNIMVFLKYDDKTYSSIEWMQAQINKKTRNIRIEIKSINKEILLAQKYGVRRSGEAVLTTGDHWVKVNGLKEEDLVDGLSQLLSQNKTTFCFTTGHGEPDIDAPEQGLASLRSFLENVGYRLKTISLDQGSIEDIKRNCSLISIVSPHTNFLPIEAVKLEQLMTESTIPFFLALDPPVSEILISTLKKEGLLLTSQLIVDEDNLAQKSPLTDIILYPSARILNTADQLKGKIYLPEVQALDVYSTSQPEPLKWGHFLITPASDKFHLIDDKNKIGPLNAAVYAVNGQGKPKRIVIGTGRWLLSQQLGFGANQQLLLEMVSWLMETKKNAWINQRLNDEVYLAITPDELFWLKMINIYGVPGFVLLTTFFFWIRRQWRS